MTKYQFHDRDWDEPDDYKSPEEVATTVTDILANLKQAHECLDNVGGGALHFVSLYLTDEQAASIDAYLEKIEDALAQCQMDLDRRHNAVGEWIGVVDQVAA